MDKAVCAVDIGSNSVRSIVCRRTASGLETVGFRRFATRLLAGVCPDSGHLGRDKIVELSAVIDGIVRDARGLGCDAFVLAGTHVLRVSANSGELISAVREKTGLSIEVLTEAREGLFAYRGAVSGCPGAGRGAPVIDVGGGSSEIIRPEGGGNVGVISIPAGAVNSMSRFSDIREPVGPGELEDVLAGMTNDFTRRLEREGVSGLSAPDVVAVGGSAFTLRKMLAAEGDCPEIGPERLTEVLGGLCALSLEERCPRFGIGPDRADIIVAGLCVWVALTRLLGINRIRISTHGVCMGLARDYFGLDRG